MHSLLVCRTCPRSEPEKGGLRQRLYELRGDHGAIDGLTLLGVECLGGCQKPLAAALDAPRKWRVRLTGLSTGDAADLLAAARSYTHSPDGYLTDVMLPSALRGRISALSPKMLGQFGGVGARRDSK